MHYYKFNITDWAHATSHLSLVDEAIYFRLINYYYDTEKPIPLELKMVLRKLRMSEYEDEVLVILDEFFEKTDKGYKNSKCETLIREYKKNIVKNRENGAKGGRPRKAAASKETEGKPTGLFSETQLEPSDNPNITLTNNYKPSTINHEPLDITPTAKPSAKKSLDYSCWPSMPSEQVLADYLALRKSKRAAMSQTVINRLAKEFNLAAQYGVTVDQCLEMAVARGWQSFQWDWYQNSTRQQSGGKSQINLNETGWLHGTADQQSVFGIGGNISGVAQCLPEPARISGGQKAMAGSFGGEPDHDFGAIEPWHQEGSEP